MTPTRSPGTTPAAPARPTAQPAVVPAQERGPETAPAAGPVQRTPRTAPEKVPSSVRLQAPLHLDRDAATVLAGEVEAQADRGVHVVVVDVARVEVMDPSTPRLLLRQHWAMQAHGGSVRLARPGRSVRRLVRWAAADELLA